MNWINKSKVRQALGPYIRTLETRYSQDKLTELVSRQNQSPGSSFYLSNLNYLSVEQIIVLIMIAYCTNEKSLRVEIISSLPGQIRRKEQELTSATIGLLCRMTQDLLIKKKPFYRKWQSYFFQFCPYRKLMGLLCSKDFHKSLDYKLKPKIVYPRKAKKGDRIRGYRDHGTCRPSHKWLPKYPFSPSTVWNLEESKRFFDKLYSKTYLENPWSFCGFTLIESLDHQKHLWSEFCRQEQERKRKLKDSGI